MQRASFEHALNDGEVTVNYLYDHMDPSYNEIESICYGTTNITAIVHPEDFEYLNGLLTEKALEDNYESRACAAEARWEADREDRLLA